MRRIFAVGIFALLLVEPIAAQSKSNTGSQLGVDLVRLRSGRMVRGAIVQRDAAGKITMVVRREWLQRALPDLAVETIRTNRENQIAAWTDVTKRLDDFLAKPPDAPRLTFFLRQESERLKKLLDNPPEDAEFLWLELTQHEVAQVTPAAPARQRIAQWGWSEGLAGVETHDVFVLTKELQKAGIKTEANPPDLSDRLPARLQTDREWSARMALLNYTLNTSFDLQGTGDTVFPAGSGKQVDVAAIMPAMLQKQLQSVLDDLTGAAPIGTKNNIRAWLPGAIRAAEDAGTNGFRVTRVDVSAESMRSNVSSEFLARMDDGRWVTIWQTTEIASGNQPRPDVEARIAQDPQVKSALEVVKGLGIGADGQVTAAIRVGAATMAAQQTVDQRFFEFRDRYVKRIDGPPLRIE